MKILFVLALALVLTASFAYVESPQIYALNAKDAATCSQPGNKCMLVTEAILDGMRRRVRDAEEALEVERAKPPVERFCM